MKVPTVHALWAESRTTLTFPEWLAVREAETTDEEAKTDIETSRDHWSRVEKNAKRRRTR